MRSERFVILKSGSLIFIIYFNYSYKKGAKDYPSPLSYNILSQQNAYGVIVPDASIIYVDVPLAWFAVSDKVAETPLVTEAFTPLVVL